MRVLYLCFFFPPSRASGVFRGRATANHLAATGWDVTVIASPVRFLREVTGVDEELAAKVDPRITTVRPHMSHYLWEKDLRRMGRFQATLPVLSLQLHRLTLRKTFPEHYLSWGIAAAKKALALHRRKKFDVVLATGNPWVSFAVAWLMNKLTGVPYIVDYRDSWTLNQFTDGPMFPAKHPARRWERRILGKAANSVHVNEALREWHAQQYPEVADRMMVVPNGWDPDLVGETGISHEPRAAEPGRPLKFGFLGTVTGVQPLEELRAAFRLARTHPDLADAELNIYGHLGFFPADAVRLRTALGLNGYEDGAITPDGIRYRGPVPKTEVSRVYEESDVLVFLTGGGRYVTTGKIFEYMAAGKPIVSVHAPETAAKDVLNGYPLWFNAESLDVPKVADSMAQAGKAARDLQPDQIAAAQEHALTYSRERLLAPLEARLRELAGS